MSNFYPSNISYLTYCVTTICLGFAQDIQILFSVGQFKKNNEKNF